MAWTESRAGGHLGRYRIDDRTKSTRVFKTKRDAREEAERQERLGKMGGWIDPKAGSIALADYFATWQAARSDRARRTVEDERERFASLIEPTFGKYPLRRLEYSEIAVWATSMVAKRTGEVASQARRRDAARLLRSVLDGAVDARLLPSNPARTPSGKTPYMPKRSKTKAHRYLSFEQLRRVADAANDEQARTLILLAGMTGLRWGEVSALTVGDADLLRGRFSVTKAYTTLTSGELLLGDTKTHASRTMALNATLRDLLRPLAAGKKKHELLFQSAAGGALRRESFGRNAFTPAVVAAGAAVSALQRLLGFEDAAVSGVYDMRTVESVRAFRQQHELPAADFCDRRVWEALAVADREKRDGLTQGEKVSRTRQLKVLARVTLSPGAEDFAMLTLHDLRHTAASLAIAQGANVKAVQQMLGHESAKLTLDTYAGLFDTDLDAVGEAMSAGFEATSAHYVPTDAAATAAGVTVLAPRKTA